MSAVKPTAEEFRKLFAEALQFCWNDWCADTDSCPTDIRFTKRGRNPEVEFISGAWARNAADHLYASLASHRQPDSALDGARNARSVEAEAVETLANNVRYHSQWINQAEVKLRAYAKLLRGERE